MSCDKRKLLKRLEIKVLLFSVYYQVHLFRFFCLSVWLRFFFAFKLFIDQLRLLPRKKQETFKQIETLVKHFLNNLNLYKKKKNNNSALICSIWHPPFARYFPPIYFFPVNTDPLDNNRLQHGIKTAQHGTKITPTDTHTPTPKHTHFQTPWSNVVTPSSIPQVCFPRSGTEKLHKDAKASFPPLNWQESRRVTTATTKSLGGEQVFALTFFFC